jgi:hypothetical protein
LNCDLTQLLLIGPRQNPTQTSYLPAIEFIDVEPTLRAQMVELIESVNALTPLAG